MSANAVIAMRTVIGGSADKAIRAEAGPAAWSLRGGRGGLICSDCMAASDWRELASDRGRVLAARLIWF